MKKLKNIYQNNNPVLNDAFDRVVAQVYIRKQKEHLNTFVISGTEPRVGATTLAINLAISMAVSGWKTLLVDCDLRKISKDKRLSGSEEKGLTEYLGGTAELDDILYPTNFKMLEYVPSGLDVRNSVSGLCSVRMRELMHEWEEKYDYVIIDVPAMSTAVDAGIVANIANAVVLVTSQQPGYTRKAIEDARKQLERVDANVLGIVVNKVDGREYRRAMKNFDYFKKRKYITKPATRKRK